VLNKKAKSKVPQSALQNDMVDFRIPVRPGKTYFLRIINMGAFAGQYFWIEDHKLTIIELDGVYHEPTEVEMIYLTAAQRVGVLLTTKDNISHNYAIVAAMDQDLFDSIPDDFRPNSTSHLVYDSSKILPVSRVIDDFEPFDDFKLVPTDNEQIFNDPAQTIILDVVMENLGDGVVRQLFLLIPHTNSSAYKIRITHFSTISHTKRRLYLPCSRY
jgi:iron transport multicopper oxidase